VKLLGDVKVVELARILAGPWAGQLLADLGADVIKVERSGVGDDTRGWGPPFVKGADGENLSAAYFHGCNRGKRSIAVDFGAEDGRKIVQDLCRNADVVIENFKTGTLAKFGLDYAALTAINPTVIYCSITGFGLTGPYAKKAGYDFIIQAMGGIMDLTGEPDGAPQKAGVATADIFTGLYAVVAIQAALIRKAATGVGAHIDLALLDTQVGVLANQAMNYLVSGVAPRRMGNAHPNLVPYQVFEAADGPIVIAVGNDRQNADLCAFLGIGAVAADPRFQSNAGRVANRAAFLAIIGPEIARCSRGELFEALEARDIPVGPINAIDEVFRDPQVVARGMQIAGDNGARAPGVRAPIVVDGEALFAPSGAPNLGEHTNEILSSLGFSADAIQALKTSKTVQGADRS
jgi:crotonobetainyl-CoA:carnitine CoA-transferase CaiB-like acyl-CoA transferase